MNNWSNGVTHEYMWTCSNMSRHVCIYAHFSFVTIWIQCQQFLIRLQISWNSLSLKTFLFLLHQSDPLNLLLDTFYKHCYVLSAKFWAGRRLEGNNDILYFWRILSTLTGKNSQYFQHTFSESGNRTQTFAKCITLVSAFGVDMADTFPGN